METNERIKGLYKKFLDNSINKTEYEELVQYFDSGEDTTKIRQYIIEALEKDPEDNIVDLHKERIDKTIRNVRNKLDVTLQPSKTKRMGVRRFIPYAAAAILLITGFISYHYLQQTSQELVQNNSHIAQDIEPGTNRATLTLDQRQPLVLNEKQTGITVGSDGISYMDGTKITENTQVQYALLSTPRKGQYQTILPDGTKVWLNAESSLQYPTAFTGNERRVKLTGEGYFEVVHNAKQPFIVETKAQQLKVLGTSFNLNAYSNEPSTVTTLLTGGIELISKRDNSVKQVKPEQQAVLATQSFTVKPVEVRSFIAWKAGEFRFKETPLHEALRQIERWYDIEVDYSNIPDEIEVFAFIRRDKKLSSVLNALEKITGLKFTLKERRLTLME